MPSGVLQSGENDAVVGDADEEERAGRGVVADGAVVVLEEAELDGTSMMCAAKSHWPETKRPYVAHRALISTRFGAGGISGLCDRRSAGPDRRAGVCAKVLLIPADLRDVRMSKGAALGIT